LTLHATANFTEEQFSDFLHQANATREATPILRRITSESEGLSVAWATRVLHLINEGGEA
jgi:hypothetical protein